MEREQIIKALECFHQRILDTDLAKNIYEAEIMAIIVTLSLIKELTEENDRLSTALAEYEHKTNIRVSEEYVPYDDYEELREENKKLIEEAENYKKIAEKQQSISMDRHFEIKRLTEENEKITINMNAYRLTAKRLAGENERLKELNKQLDTDIFNSEMNLDGLLYELDLLKQEKSVVVADTVKKMQERLKEKAYTNNYWHEVVLVSDIDQIAKEMLEGNDGK